MSGVQPPLLFIIAGEPSGDILGGRLMAALTRQTGGRLRFAGVGGPAMAAQGLQSLFPMADLTVMGLAEVLPRIPKLLARIRQTAAAARAAGARVVITIDAPDFSFRVAAKLKGLGIPLVHFVAPSVWAWRPGRAGKMAALFDHLLCLLPFEPPYFQRAGLAATFVGHPVLESGAGGGDGPAFRSRHGIAAAAPLLAILPGSRAGEVARLLGVFGETAGRLGKCHPGLAVVVPTVPGVAGRVRAGVGRWPVPALVIEGDADKFAAFAAADAAIAASGTVGLELAMAGTPHVIGYRVNGLTAWLARRLLRVAFVNLVNILLDRQAVPELLQEACTPGNLGDQASRLLAGGDAADEQRAALAEALAMLAGDGQAPSGRAASVVLELINQKTGESR